MTYQMHLQVGRVWTLMIKGPTPRSGIHLHNGPDGMIQIVLRTRVTTNNPREQVGGRTVTQVGGKHIEYSGKAMMSEVGI